MDIIFDTDKIEFTYSADIFGNLSDSILTIYKYSDEEKQEIKRYLYNVDIVGVDCKNIDFVGEATDNLEELTKEAYKNIYYQLRKYFDVDGLALCTGVFYTMAINDKEYEEYQDFQENLKLNFE